MASIVMGFSACDDVKRALVEYIPRDYEVEAASDAFRPVFDGPDEGRERVLVTLRPVADGFSKVTDIRFMPGSTRWMVVLEKAGRASWVDLTDGRTHPLLKMDVATASEQGLLGLSFFPDFARTRRMVVNATIKREGKRFSQISVWTLPKGEPPLEARFSHVILEVEQPYANHNGGCVAFGPDGMLYIGFGDGGWRADPHHNGQNGRTFLGSMLRLDIRASSPEKPYVVPPDNPFVGRDCCRPEIYAIGLRNPWRFSFGLHGELIVADVGQDKWEEIDVIPPGANAGWPIMEAFHCFEPASGCRREGLLPPIYAYPHPEGISVTGGYVYRGKRIPELKGRYVFGDFGTGRLWALSIPPKAHPVKSSIPGRDADEGPDLEALHLKTLGRWPILISTFGIDGAGEIYVADFQTGKIYRIEDGRNESKAR